MSELLKINAFALSFRLFLFFPRFEVDVFGSRPLSEYLYFSNVSGNVFIVTLQAFYIPCTLS